MLNRNYLAESRRLDARPKYNRIRSLVAAALHDRSSVLFRLIIHVRSYRFDDRLQRDALSR